nr:hypothetical protein [Parachlamydiaceae bacterium]
MTGGINTQNTGSTGSLNPTIDSSIPTATSTPAAETNTTGKPPIRDTSEAAENNNAPQTDYQRSSGKPSLPAPAANVGTVDEAVINQIFNPNQFIEFLKSSDLTPTPS